MQTWASDELRSVSLGDLRRSRRLIQIVEALASQPSVSVPRACGTWAATKATYRFWDNDHVCAEQIRTAHAAATSDRIGSLERVLIAQDTTELDFTSHQTTQGLGPLRRWTQGLLAHTALAITCDGVPLGVVAQQIWAREAKAKAHRRKRSTKEKESQRWLTTQAEALAVVPEEVAVVTIADREADIYDLFAQPRRAGADLLIRATHNRKVDHSAAYLWQALRQASVMDTQELDVGRTPTREPRTAKLTLRFLQLSIQPPRHHLQRAQAEAVPVTALLVEEVEAPPGTKALQWLLLSTMMISDVTMAWQLVRWYCLRWLVERYHFVLKSGCRIESLQLGSALQLERALATYSIVAWRLLWLTYQARAQPDQSCEVALEKDEWQALAATHYQDASLAMNPPSLAQAILWIANLGGFLSRKNDGLPGVKTLWQGLQRLHDITNTWRLLHNSPTRPPPQKDVGNG